MTDVRHLLVDEVSGKAFAELPLEFDGPIQFRKNSVGQTSASFPCDHPAASKENLTEGLRSITVMRDDQPEASLLIADIDTDSDSRRVNLSLVEASAYFDHRFVEVHKNFTATDRFDIIDDIWTEVTTKTSTADDGTGSPGTDINADVPRFSISTVQGSSSTMDLEGAGKARLSVAEYLEKVSENDDGIEWCMGYSSGSTRQSCLRTLILGHPLGVDQDITLTEQMLVSWGKTFSPLRSGTRWHVRAAGYTATKQNTGSLTDWPLIDQRVDRANVTKHDHADDVAREFRRKGQPPLKAIRLGYRPGLSLPFGWCGIGDNINLDINDPCDLLNITADSRRVEGIDWYPPQAGQQERVDLLMHLKLSDTGA